MSWSRLDLTVETVLLPEKLFADTVRLRKMKENELKNRCTNTMLDVTTQALHLSGNP